MALPSSLPMATTPTLRRISSSTDRTDASGTTTISKPISRLFVPHSMDLTIKRGIVIVEGNYLACQTTIEGTFVREFTHLPVGATAAERAAGDL